MCRKQAESKHELFQYFSKVIIKRKKTACFFNIPRGETRLTGA